MGNLGKLLKAKVPRTVLLSIGLVVFVAPFIVVLGTLIYTLVYIPSKGTNAFDVGRRLAAQIDTYYRSYGRLPEGLTSLPARPPVNRNLVSSIDHDPLEGSVRVTLAFSPVAGDYYRLVPRVHEKKIHWFCEPVCRAPDCIKLFMGACVNSMTDRASMLKETEARDDLTIRNV